MLVLSEDEAIFRNALRKTNLPATSHKIIQVPHEKLYQHLAAADSGLLFRKKDNVNWIARPTKMLEYQSIGLTIIHNDTIEWLAKAEK